MKELTFKKSLTKSNVINGVKDDIKVEIEIDKERVSIHGLYYNFDDVIEIAEQIKLINKSK